MSALLEVPFWWGAGREGWDTNWQWSRLIPEWSLRLWSLLALTLRGLAGPWLTPQLLTTIFLWMKNFGHVPIVFWVDFILLMPGIKLGTSYMWNICSFVPLSYIPGLLSYFFLFPCFMATRQSPFLLYCGQIIRLWDFHLSGSVVHTNSPKEQRGRKEIVHLNWKVTVSTFTVRIWGPKKYYCVKNHRTSPAIALSLECSVHKEDPFIALTSVS